MATPTSVPPFHATIGKPPAKSFAGCTRDAVGNVVLSAHEWAQANPGMYNMLKLELSRQLHGNPSLEDDRNGPWNRRELGMTMTLRLMQLLPMTLLYPLREVQDKITGYTPAVIVGHDGERRESGEHKLDYGLGLPISSLHALGGISFSSTDVFQRYLLHTATVESRVNGPRAERRNLASMDLALHAETTCPENSHNGWDDEDATPTLVDKDDFFDGPPSWSVLEGIANVVPGPFAYVRERDIDTELFSELSPEEQSCVPQAMKEAALARVGDPKAWYMYKEHRETLSTYPNGVPVGYSRFKDHCATDIKLAQSIQDELVTMTRVALSQTMFHLLAAHEMFGTVYASALVCTRFTRFYVLGANRVAVELVTASQSLPPPSDTVQNRGGVSYSQLQSSRAFDRLPWSLSKDHILTPRFPSVKYEPCESKRVEQLYSQDVVDDDALQTYMTFGAAAAVRIATMDRTRALKRMPTPLQDHLLQEMTEATMAGLSNAGLPAELGLEILEHVVGGMRHHVKGSEDNPGRDGSSPAIEGVSEMALNVEALERTLEDATMYVPVSPAEMDALVAAQLQSDLDRFTPDDSPCPRRLRHFGCPTHLHRSGFARSRW